MKRGQTQRAWPFHPWWCRTRLWLPTGRTKCYFNLPNVPAGPRGQCSYSVLQVEPRCAELCYLIATSHVNSSSITKFASIMSVDELAWECRCKLTQCGSIESLSEESWAQSRLIDFNLWAIGLGVLAEGDDTSTTERLDIQPSSLELLSELLHILYFALEACYFLGTFYVFAILHALKNDLATKIEYNDQVLENDERKHRASGEQVSSSSSRDSPEEQSSNVDDVELNPQRLPATLAEACSEVDESISRLQEFAIIVRRSGDMARIPKTDQYFEAGMQVELRTHLEFLLRTTNLLDYIAFRRRLGYTLETVVERSNFELRPEQRRLVDANAQRRHRFEFSYRRALHRQPSSSEMDLPLRLRLGTPDGKVDSDAEHGRIAISHPTSLNETSLSIIKTHSSLEIERDALLNPTRSTEASPTVATDQLLALRPKSQEVTAVSSITGKLRYPAPPMLSESASSFSCPCCHHVLTDRMASSNGRWK